MSLLNLNSLLETFRNSKEFIEATWFTPTFNMVISRIVSVMNMNNAQGKGFTFDHALKLTAQYTHVHYNTVRAILRIAIAREIFRKVDITHDGRDILSPGKWFSDRAVIQEQKKKDSRCGTIYKPVNNHVDNLCDPYNDCMPPHTTNVPPPYNDCAHITNSLTNSDTNFVIPLIIREQQQEVKNLNKGKNKMINLESDVVDEIIGQSLSDMPSNEYKESCAKKLVNTLPNLIKTPKDLLMSDKMHKIKALEEMALRLGKTRELNHKWRD